MRELTNGTTHRPMMHVKTVSVTYGRKFNLGDYNSATFEVTLWADLDETETDHHAAVLELQADARELVKDAALPLLRDKR